MGSAHWNRSMLGSVRPTVNDVVPRQIQRCKPLCLGLRKQAITPTTPLGLAWNMTSGSMSVMGFFAN